MFRQINRLTLVVLCVVSLALVSASAFAQGEAFKPYIAAVTKDQIFVHSGADSRYYPFATLSEGDLVQVVGEKSGWARIATAGAAFDGMFGYIKYPLTDTGRFRLADDKKTGVTLAMLDLIAPNMNENDSPDHSWKPIGPKLSAGQTVRVLETIETDREIVHKVALPADCSGWTNLIYLRKASDAEVAAWQAALGTSGRPIEPKTHDSQAASPDVQPVKARALEPVPDINPVPADDQLTAPTNDGLTGMSAQQNGESATSDEGEAGFNIWHEKLLDLEDAFKALSAGSPLESADVGPLRAKYEEMVAATSEVEPVISRFAQRRADQLTLLSEVQQRKANLAKLRQRVQVATEEFDAAKHAIAMSGDYAAVGRLEASQVYNGKNLPELYRIQDEKSGRTIAYIKPDPEFHLAGLLGQVVGIAGEIEYDGTLRVNILTPRHIDVLAPKQNSKK